MKSPETTTSAAPRSSAEPRPDSQPADPVTLPAPASASPPPQTQAVATAAVGSGRRRAGFALCPDGNGPPISLFYEVTGLRAPAPTLLLCDGLGCDGYVWKYLTWALAAEYRIIHLQYRGHGQSSPPADLQNMRLSDFARDAVAVLDACECDRAVFVGHSMGVQVALEAYNQTPERVSGLVLICGSYGHPLRTFKGSDRLESLLPVLRATVSRMPRVVSAFWRRALPTQLSFYIAQQVEIDGSRVRREDFLPYLEGLAAMDPRMFVCTMAAAGQHTAKDILSRIAVPTLIVAGRRDSFTPMTLSEEMAQVIPGAELHIIESGTHTAPIERPAEMAATIGSFLRRRILPPALPAVPTSGGGQ
jgi:pimeloyl-ACP methyl ester carboxylesterase